MLWLWTVSFAVAWNILLSIELLSDAAFNRKILKMLLTKAEVEVDLAEDGLEAVEIVRSNPHKYDIIFLDNLMPKMVNLFNFCQY